MPKFKAEIDERLKGCAEPEDGYCIVKPLPNGFDRLDEFPPILAHREIYQTLFQFPLQAIFFLHFFGPPQGTCIPSRVGCKITYPVPHDSAVSDTLP